MDSLQNKRISGEQRRKRGERELRAREGSLKALLPSHATLISPLFARNMQKITPVLQATSGRKLNLRKDLRWVAKRTRKFPRKYTQVAKKKLMQTIVYFIKPWPNGVASSRKLRTQVYLRLRHGLQNEVNLCVARLFWLMDFRTRYIHV